MSSIGFIGFQGSGKTTIGRMVASTLLLPWYDTDLLIAPDGDIAKVYSEVGENAFRMLEVEAVCLLPSSPKVVSFGGGALGAIKEAYSVGMKLHYLYIPFEALWEKCRERKPLWLSPLTEEKLRTLWQERHTLFFQVAAQLHDMSIATPKQVNQEIVDGYGK